MGDALAAQRATGLFDGQSVAHAHVQARRAVLDVPYVAALHLVAYLYAAQAPHALRAIADEREALVPGREGRLLLVGHVEDVELLGEVLQHTVAVAHAGRALHVMLGEQQRHVDAPRLEHAWGVGMDDHAVFERGVAGGHESLDALDLDDAHAARADVAYALEAAQRGHVVARSKDRLDDLGTFRERDGRSVDRCVYHENSLPPRNAPRPNLSHLRHLSDSCEASWLERPHSIIAKSRRRTSALRSVVLERPQGMRSAA